MFNQRIEKITRYPNRKYYHRGFYICQRDIKDLIDDNKPIQVVDKTTGADITRQVLASMLWLKTKPQIEGMALNDLIQELRSRT